MNTGDIAIILAVAGFIWQVIREVNKPRVDASQADKNSAEAIASLVESLAKQGKTVTDLFNALSEIPQLKSELKDTRHDLKAAQARIEENDRRMGIIISFAREVWSGSKRLHAQVMRSGEQPEYVPPERFPTGPLGKLVT